MNEEAWVCLLGKALHNKSRVSNMMVLGKRNQLMGYS